MNISVMNVLQQWQLTVLQVLVGFPGAEVKVIVGFLGAEVKVIYCSLPSACASHHDHLHGLTIG